MDCRMCAHSKVSGEEVHCKNGGSNRSEDWYPSWRLVEVHPSDANQCLEYEEAESKVDRQEISRRVLQTWSDESSPSWTTAEGGQLKVREMGAQHLENALCYMERKNRLGQASYRNLLMEDRRRRLMQDKDKVTVSKKRRVTVPKKSSFLDSFFRQVDDVVFDFQVQKLGIVSKDGIFTYDADTEESMINPIEFFSAPVPAYAVRTPLSEINLGDIVSVSNTRCGFVSEISVKKDRVKVIYSSGTQGWIKPPKNVAFGSAAVMCVKNVFGGAELNPMLMAMMATDGEGMDTDAMAMMAMMGGGGGAMSNMMLPMLMMQKEDFNVKDMMLFSALQGGNGMKLFPMATEEVEPEKKEGSNED